MPANPLTRVLYTSSTPKSVSKPSVKVYHGISQPIRAFTRSMSGHPASARNQRPAVGVEMVGMLGKKTARGVR